MIGFQILLDTSWQLKREQNVMVCYLTSGVELWQYSLQRHIVKISWENVGEVFGIAWCIGDVYSPVLLPRRKRQMKFFMKDLVNATTKS